MGESMTLALKITAIVCFLVGVYYIFWEGNCAALFWIGVALFFQADASSALVEIQDARLRGLVAFAGLALMAVGVFSWMDNLGESAPELPPPP